MSDELIKDFTALTDAQADDNTKLLPFGIASSGKLYKVTVAQAKLIFSSSKLKYVATGSEGTTITISALAGKEILHISREGTTIYEVNSSPDSLEFIWNTTNIITGTAIGAGERFLILYKNI